MPTSMKGLILYCFFDRHFVPGTSIVLGGVGCCCCSRQEKRVHTADSLAVSQCWSSSLSVVASLPAPTYCRGHCCSARSKTPFLLILCMHATSSTSFPFPAPPTSSRSTQHRAAAPANGLLFVFLCVPTSCCCLLLTDCSLHRQHGHILREGYI